VGDVGGIFSAQGLLGDVAVHERDYDRATAAFSAALAGWRSLGDTQGTARILHALGRVAYEQSDYARAAELYEETLAIRRSSTTHPWTVPNVLRSLGELALAKGDLVLARARLVESLTLAREVGESWQIAAALELLGNLAVVQAQPQRALRLLGAAAMLREQADQLPSADEQTALACTFALARQALTGNAQEAAWTEGRTMALEHAVAYALEPTPAYPSLLS
jgi:tetratricopeptide (TPR) repeat protein